MDDKALLETLGQMLSAQEMRISALMDKKLEGQKKEIKAELRQEVMQDMKLLMDTEVQTRFNLLAEDLDILKEKLLGVDDLEALQDQLDLQYAMLRKHTREIADLKKAN